MADELSEHAMDILRGEHDKFIKPFLESTVAPLIRRALDGMGYDKTVFHAKLEAATKLEMRPDLGYKNAGQYYYIFHRCLEILSSDTKFPYRVSLKKDLMVIGQLKLGVSLCPPGASGSTE